MKNGSGRGEVTVFREKRALDSCSTRGRSLRSCDAKREENWRDEKGGGPFHTYEGGGEEIAYRKLEKSSCDIGQRCL